MKMLLAFGGVLAVLVGIPVVAQDEAPSDGSLAALTAEVRLLRVAVEQSTRTQTQLQGLSVFLSAQQSRLIQVSAHVDTLRRDLDAAVGESRSLADRASQVQASLSGQLGIEDREALEEMRDSLAVERRRAGAIETQIRARESEASATLQTELGRWSDLIGRMEQMIRP